MHHHRMSFFWDTDIGEVLFPGLNVSGTTALCILGLILVILAVGYEGLKVVQTQARARAARERIQTTSCAASETATLLTNNGNSVRSQPSFSKKLTTLSRQAMIFLFHTALGYIIMLTVMLYNGYIFIFVIFGMGLGYFLFGHVSMKINMENIRARTTNVMCSSRCPAQPTNSGFKNTTRTGYTNEIEDSHSCDSNSNDTQSSHLPNVEVEPSGSVEESVIYSCRL